MIAWVGKVRSPPCTALSAAEMSGVQVRVKCSPDDTVGDLKKLIAAQTGTDPSKVRNAVEKHAGKPSAGDPGKVGLPPAQKVTRPPPSESVGGGEQSQTNGGAASGLAKYAPDSKDPATG